MLWPGVADPVALLTAVTAWLSGYVSRETRATYATALGLPTGTTSLSAWLDAPGADPAFAAALGDYAEALGTSRTAVADQASAQTSGRTRRAPPPHASGRLRECHWFRWCATHARDPLQVTARDVTTWLDALAQAGAAPATRDRMLATLKTLYAHLTDTGLVTANPATLNRRRLGLSRTGATSATITLTAAQVRTLYEVAGTPRPGVSALAAARAQAIVGLLTLGLRVSELCELDVADVHVTRGRRALRVPGKGDKPRVVYLSGLAETALQTYLRARPEATSTSADTRIARPAPDAAPARTPLITTRTGSRTHRADIHALLRRVAAAAGDELAAIADRIHPHTLRHFYVTTAVEAGAQLAHVQADLGHTSIDVTDGVYNAAARHPDRSAVDLVATTLTPPQDPADEPSTGPQPQPRK
jgi:site-specific recombinase XerD